MVVFLVLMTFVLFEYRRLPYTPHRCACVVSLAAEFSGALMCTLMCATASPSCVAEWLPDAHTLQSPTPWLLLCYCRVENVMARLQMRTRAFAAIFLLLCVGLVRR
jgi:hypothetical protein